MYLCKYIGKNFRDNRINLIYPNFYTCYLYLLLTNPEFLHLIAYPRILQLFLKHLKSLPQKYTFKTYSYVQK